jgi:hypothetical protein
MSRTGIDPKAKRPPAESRWVGLRLKVAFAAKADRSASRLAPSVASIAAAAPGISYSADLSPQHHKKEMMLKAHRLKAGGFKPGSWN